MRVSIVAIMGLLLANAMAPGLNIRPASGAGSWGNADWAYRKAIAIDHTKVSADLTTFPVLIDVTDADLISKAQPNGNDIIFTDGVGVKLAHEIELYSSTGHLVAWVKVPSLSSTEDTVLYMYYGNPSAGNQQNKTGVWDSDYLMVQHLSETSGTQYDSTANGKNATPNGEVSQGVTGKIDGADSFSGSASQYLAVGSISASDWTISFWANSRSVSGLAIYPVGLGGTAGIGVGGVYTDHPNDFYVFDGSSLIHGGPLVQTGTWYHVTVTRSGTTYTIYVNGTSQVSGTLSSVSISNMNIGRRSDNMLAFNGIVDEVRVSDMPRSSTWILTEYNGQSSPSTFYTIGSEETEYPVLKIIPITQTCRKYDENFTIAVTVSNDNNLTEFQFEIDYNTTLLDYVGVAWNAWLSGTITVDEAGGNVTGITAGTAISGLQTLVTIQFDAAYHHIWKDESKVSGWKNNQTGTIFIQRANLSCTGSPDFAYVRGGGSNHISVGADLLYTFEPVQGDLDNNGVVDILDLRTIAAYYDQVNVTYDLNGDNIIDIFDLIIIGANYGVTYP